jgi:stage II sporulation protein AB (anti-sigma F factor)
MEPASKRQAQLHVSESRLAVAAAVPWARQLVSTLAASAGVRGQRLEDVRLLVSEAVTNTVLHAYGDSPGEVHVIAAILPGELWVIVADDGDGMRTGESERGGLGLGLALMARLSDGLTIATRSNGGVEARMCFNLDPPPQGDLVSRADR